MKRARRKYFLVEWTRMVPTLVVVQKLGEPTHGGAISKEKQRRIV